MPRSLIFSLLCAALAPAAEVPREIEEIIGLARALPAEFAADVLLDVATRASFSDKKRRKELLEDAFVLASRARETYSRRPLPGIAPDSHEAILAQSYRFGLDQLNLQVRAIRALGNPPDLLPQLPPPPRPLTCDDRFVWDTAAFWELAGDNPPRPIASPTEIGPAVRLVERFSEDKEKVDRLSLWLLDGVARLGGDDRAFTATLSTAPRELERIAILRARHGLSATPAITAVGAYLKRHLTGPRCADTLDMSAGWVSAALWQFNERMRRTGYLGNEEIAELLIDETAAAVSSQPQTAPDWFDEVQHLSDPDAIADSKLQDSLPLVWFLKASEVIQPDSRNLVIACYSRLKNLHR